MLGGEHMRLSMQKMMKQFRGGRFKKMMGMMNMSKMGNMFGKQS